MRSSSLTVFCALSGIIQKKREEITQAVPIRVEGSLDSASRPTKYHEGGNRETGGLAPIFFYSRNFLLQ
jgi:hypothetical protein